MDSTTAFGTALAVTTAAGVTSHLVTRAATARPRPLADSGAWQQAQQRRTDTYTEFATAADEIATTAALWPALPAAARPKQQDTARAHLRRLKRLEGLVALGGGRQVQAAALQLLEECRRLVDSLTLDAPAGPTATPAMLSPAFLVACREHLDAEAERRFGLRPAWRSLVARLSPR